MTLVALKNVRKEVWHHFKSESALHGMKMSEFFEKLLEEHSRLEKQGAQAWRQILSGKRLLTEKEARILQSEMHNFRKEFDFRDL